MSQTITVKGNTPKELAEKKDALDQLSNLDAKVLKRIAELSSNPKALKYFQNSLLFASVKGFLK